MHQCSPKSRYLGRTSLVLAGRYEICAQYHNAKPKNVRQQSDKFHTRWANPSPHHANNVVPQQNDPPSLAGNTNSLFASIGLSKNRSSPKSQNTGFERTDIRLPLDDIGAVTGCCWDCYDYHYRSGPLPIRTGTAHRSGGLN